MEATKLTETLEKAKMNRPVCTILDASWLLSLSASTIKRKLKSGELKAVNRINNKEKILIYTDSIKNFLSKGE